MNPTNLKVRCPQRISFLQLRTIYNGCNETNQPEPKDPTMKNLFILVAYRILRTMQIVAITYAFVQAVRGFDDMYRDAKPIITKKIRQLRKA